MGNNLNVIYWQEETKKEKENKKKIAMDRKHILTFSKHLLGANYFIKIYAVSL